MTPEDLVGISEIAEICHVTVPAVSNWRKRQVNFPQPWGEWKCGPLYLRSEIESWHADRLAERQRSLNAQIAWHEKQLARLTS